MSYHLRPEIHLDITIWPPRISYRRGVWHAYGRTSRRLKYMPIPIKSDVYLGWATTREGACNLGEGWGARS